MDGASRGEVRERIQRVHFKKTTTWTPPTGVKGKAVRSELLHQAPQIVLLFGGTRTVTGASPDLGEDRAHAARHALGLGPSGDFDVLAVGAARALALAEVELGRALNF